MNNKKTTFVILALVLVLTAAIFYPSLKNGFTNWDDDEYLTENPAVRPWSWSNTVRIFTTFTTSVYAPLAVLTYSAEYRFVKLKPFLYHLDNLILHLMNCSLVFFLILMLVRDPRAAGCAALFFAIHPLRVESVAWITERKDVLAVCFGLASMIAYVRSVRDRSRLGYIIALVLFPLSLLAKPMALTFPFLFLLIDRYLGRKIDRAARWEKVPFFVLALGLFAVNVRAQGTALHAAVEYVRHLFLGAYCLIFYVVKTILPVNLSALYPYPYHSGQPMPAVYYASPLVLAAAAGLGWYFGRRDRRIAFGLLFFLIAILPVSQFLPLAGPALTADRYAYFPGIGIALLAGIGMTAALDPKRTHARIFRPLAAVLGSAVFIALATATALRCRVWHDGITLWNDVIAKQPRAALAYDNRGILYAQANRFDRALADFNRALEIDPRLVKAYYNRGLAYFQTGDTNQALADVSRAVGFNPLNPRFINTRGIIYSGRGDRARAYDDFTAAIGRDPSFAEAYNNRSNVLRADGELARARADLDRALELDPRFADAYYNRAVTFFLMKDYEAAYADLKKYESLGGLVPPEFYQDLRRARPGRSLN